MLGAYDALLRRLADDPAAWEEERRSLVPAEQLENRRAVNATEAPVTPALLHTLFAAKAVERGDRPAVVTERRTLTYGELARLTARLARILRQEGARPNRLVAVVLEKGWEQIAAMLGVLASSAAYLPIDPDLPAGGRRGDRGAHGDPSRRDAGVAGRGAAPLRGRDRGARRSGRRRSSAGAAAGTGGPRLRDLHVGLDRQAQGRHDRPPRRRQHDPRHQRAVRRGSGGPGAGALLAELRSLGLRRLRSSGRGRDGRRAGAGRGSRPGALGGASRLRAGHDLELRAGAHATSDRVPRRPGRASAGRAAPGPAQRRLDPALAAGAGQDVGAGRRGREPGRGHGGVDLVDPPSHRRRGSRLDEHPLRDASAKPAPPRARRGAGAAAGVGAGRSLHRRDRSGARLLARPGAHRRELPDPSADGRAPVPHGRSRTLPARRHDRVPGPRGLPGEDPGP